MPETLVAEGDVSPEESGCGAGTGICTITPDIPLTAGESYTWWVAAGNDSGYEWSEGISFTVRRL